MNFIFFGVLLAFVLYPIVSARGQLDEDNKTKPYTMVTTLMGVAIFLSIILSIAIVLSADMPDSIGFGGFTYIIRPSFYGILVLILYLVSVKVRPDWKFISGLVCVMINVIIGLIYFLSEL